MALDSLPVSLVRLESLVEIDLSYPHVDGLRRALDELDAEVVAEDYGVRVRYRVAVPSSRLEELRSRLADLTRGDGIMRDGSAS